MSTKPEETVETHVLSYYGIVFQSWLPMAVGVCIVLIYLYRNLKYSYWKKKNIDCLQPTWPFGNLAPALTLRKTFPDIFLEFYFSAKESYLGIYLLTTPALIVKDPEAIKEILVRDFNSFIDRGLYADEEREPTSGHLFRLSGQRWKSMRNKLTPSFTIGKLKMMFPTMLDIARKMDKHLYKLAEETKITDVNDNVLRFTADVIASVVFGLEYDSFEEPNNEFVTLAKALFCSSSFSRLLRAFMIMITPSILKYAFKTVPEKPDKFISRIVREVAEYRETNKYSRNDIMQLLVQLKNKGQVNVNDDLHDLSSFGKEEGNEGLTFNELSAQAFTFFFAGYETSAATLTFLLYECALNPDIQKRIHRNIDEILVRYNGEITYEAVHEMDLLNRAIAETLRKYPVVPMISRQSVKDYILPNTNTLIEQGTKVFIPVQGLHYDPKYFPNPNKFDPDRFLPEESEKRHSFCYLPFGEGPRNCLGKKLGQLMVSVGAATVLKNYTVSVCSKTEIPIQFDRYTFAILPRNPVYLEIATRRA